MSANLLFVLQVLMILALPYIVWRYGRLSRIVPWVVIQILAGIAFGPSGLGRLFPEIYASLFTPASLAHISGIAAIAVLFFGFTAGLHLDEHHYRGRGVSFAFVSAGSVLVPTMLGALAGFWIFNRFPEEMTQSISASQFMLAVGIAAGVTALPVLSAILSEMHLVQDRIGQWALGLAAVNDASLWILLSLLLADTAGIGNGGLGSIAILALGAVYLAGMVWIVRPFLSWLFVPLAGDFLGDGALIGVVTVAVGSAALTEAMGLHYIFGAFVAGATMPEELRKPILERMQSVISVLLMPFFFMSTGLQTKIDLSSSAFVQVFLLVSAAAIAGKIACKPFVGETHRRDRRQSRQGRDLQQCSANVEPHLLLAQFATEGRR